MTIVSTRPYMIRAIHEWCSDQGFTPYIAAVVDGRTRVPPGYARDGQIVLNVGMQATQQLVIDNESVSFVARFNGAPHSVFIPVGNVVAIYARENGHGMAFEAEAADMEESPADVSPAADGAAGETSVPPQDDPPPRGGHLKIVK